MGYTYTNGDGVSVLVATEPNGATEPVSNLDDAIKQIKAWIRDTTSNVGAAGMQSAITALQAAIASGAGGSALFKANVATAIDFVFGGAATVTETFVATSIEFNPDSAYTSGSSKFTAPAAGYYEFTLRVHLDVSAGSPTGNSFLARIKKNGTGIDGFGGDLAGTTYIDGMTTIVQLAEGDEITADIAITITGGSGTWTLNTGTGSSFQGKRLR